MSEEQIDRCVVAFKGRVVQWGVLPTIANPKVDEPGKESRMQSSGEGKTRVTLR